MDEVTKELIELAIEHVKQYGEPIEVNGIMVEYKTTYVKITTN